MGNSVIYRPAYDAEVEYLESTGTQWIDTNVIPASSWKIEIEYLVTQSGCFLFGSRTSYQSSDSFSSYMNSPLGIYIQYDGNQERINGVGNSLNQKYKLIMSADGAFLDDVKIRDANSNIFTCPCNLYLFAKNQPNEDGSDRPFKGYIYYCKVWDSNNTLVRDFIPVRIGSIGYLYDKVTKQLFANKGTGQFTLGNDVSNAVIPQQRCVLYFGNQRSVGFERIYEEYEWLCGRNGAYIDTNYNIKAGVDTFDIHFKYDGTMRNPDGLEQNIFGCLSNDYYFARAYINGANAIGVNYFKLKNQNFPFYERATNADIQSIRIEDAEHFAYSVNGNEHIVPYTWMGNKTLTPTCYLFYLNSQPTGNAGKYFHGDIAYFRITDPTFSTDRVNMTPCHLLRPIPATLDGNGIAREAGECGMWDKVSNKFYGNVANSGTFTVKGPKCYEEYEWLKVQTTTQTGTYLTLSLGTSMNFSFKRVWLSDFVNTWYFSTPGYVYYTDNHRLVVVWDSANSVMVNSGDTSTIDVGDVITIESTPDLLLINGKTINRYNYVSGAVSLTNVVAREITSLTSSVTVDGSVRYVPCKLTHGIPASMDANGIARPSGTCGMWDKVNDLFYGNVANSGTFTVSND